MDWLKIDDGLPQYPGTAAGLIGEPLSKRTVHEYMLAWPIIRTGQDTREHHPL